MTRVVVIPGDGIGPEVVAAAKRCLAATGANLSFAEAVMGQDAIDEHGTPLPDETVEAVRDAGVALKGPVTTPIGSGFRSVNVALRRKLDLYANVRPVRHLPGVPSALTDPEQVDLVVVRENLEDLYAGIEFSPGGDMQAFLASHGHDLPDDAAYSVKPISRTGSERLIRHAFEHAEQHGRDSVAVVDKANIMKETDGLFMDVGEQVAEDFPAIAHQHVLVDNMAQQLVMHPGDYDVIATQNIYGDILSDLAAGLVGGVGIAPSANVGTDAAVFASVHGTAPDIAGTDAANPTALIRSAAMLLRHLDEEAEADALESALHRVLANGPRTRDLGGDASTTGFTDAVIAALD